MYVGCRYPQLVESWIERKIGTIANQDKVNRPNLGQTSITTSTNLRGVRQTNTNGFQTILRGIVFSQPTLLAE